MGRRAAAASGFARDRGRTPRRTAPPPTGRGSTRRRKAHRARTESRSRPSTPWAGWRHRRTPPHCGGVRPPWRALAPGRPCHLFFKRADRAERGCRDGGGSIGRVSPAAAPSDGRQGRDAVPAKPDISHGPNIAEAAMRESFGPAIRQASAPPPREPRPPGARSGSLGPSDGPKAGMKGRRGRRLVGFTS